MLSAYCDIVYLFWCFRLRNTCIFYNSLFNKTQYLAYYITVIIFPDLFSCFNEWFCIISILGLYVFVRMYFYHADRNMLSIKTNF